jgi:hypothetical protein
MPTVIWVGRKAVIEMGCRMGSRTTIMTISKITAANSGGLCESRIRPTGSTVLVKSRD